MIVDHRSPIADCRRSSQQLYHPNCTHTHTDLGKIVTWQSGQSGAMGGSPAPFASREMVSPRVSEWAGSCCQLPAAVVVVGPLCRCLFFSCHLPLPVLMTLKWSFAYVRWGVALFHLQNWPSELTIESSGEHSAQFYCVALHFLSACRRLTAARPLLGCQKQPFDIYTQWQWPVIY